MTRKDFIKAIIAQVESHTFHHLYRNKQTGHSGVGWAGGLSMYSPNQKEPQPLKHFQWLDEALMLASKAGTPARKARLANAILVWGGMKQRDFDSPKGVALLQSVIDSAKAGKRIRNAPMNSSYTKIASIFGYDNDLNTIWDSRAASALCYRIALVATEKAIPASRMRTLFPELGYVLGTSQRSHSRKNLIQGYWKNGYGSWDAHFAGAALIREISNELVAQNVECPDIGTTSTPRGWSPWKVNMVFFSDDFPQYIDGHSDGHSEATLAPKGGPTSPTSKPKLFMVEKKNYFALKTGAGQANVGALERKGCLNCKKSSHLEKVLKVHPNFARSSTGESRGVAGTGYAGWVDFGSLTKALEFLRLHFELNGDDS